MKKVAVLAVLTAWILVLGPGAASGAVPSVPIDPGEPPASAFAPALAIEACELPGLDRTARCGTLTVPEDPGNVAGRKIDLHLVVLPARSGTVGRDAVTYLVGGPGQAAVAGASFFGDSLRGLQEHHDLVLVDQRGTGLSRPLRCELTPNELVQAFFSGSVESSRLEACLAGLDADPALYTTPIAMDDLDAVRAALGYERFHLVGVSYGSRAALVYARRHPERVASLVLRGVTSPADNVPVDWLQNGEAAMEALLVRCEADRSCGRAYPRLREQLARVLDRLAEKPETIGVDPPTGGAPVELEVGVDVFAGALQLALYGDRGAARVPHLVARAAEGDFAPFADLAARTSLASGGALSLGMYLSVICAEDVPFYDAAAVETRDWHFQRKTLLENLAKTCEAWPSGTVPEGYKHPVVSTAPALLLSGSADPATSLRQARDVARYLPRSRHVISPGLGHHPSWTSCFAQITGAFLEGVEPEALDTGCAAEARATSFLVPTPRWPWAAFGGLVVVLVVAARRRRARRRA